MIPPVVAGWLFERALIRLAAYAQVYAGTGNVPYAALVGLALYIVVSPTGGFPFTWGYPQYGPYAIHFLQKYFSGAMLAAYLHSRADAGYPQFRWLSIGATVLLVTVFILGVTVLPAATHGHPNNGFDVGSLREMGVSMVLWCALVAGLASANDPIAQLLNRLPPHVNDFARDLSGAVYLFQYPVALLLYLWYTMGAASLCPHGNTTWPFFPGLLSGVQLLGLLAVLLPFGALVHFGVQKPFADMMKKII